MLSRSLRRHPLGGRMPWWGRLPAGAGPPDLAV